MQPTHMADHGLVTRTALADSVFSILRNQFLDGTRAAGEPLNIAILSRELNVSQTPIREALARLEATGLVQRESLRGYRVAPLFTDEDLVALNEARAVLEPALARAAAARVTPEFLATLRQTLDTPGEASASAENTRPFPTSLATDQSFHAAIAHQSGNPFLNAAYTALSDQVQRFRLLAGPSDAGGAATEHRKIYEALERRDGELAAEWMLIHVSKAGTRALRDLSETRKRRANS